ncbi:MAG: ankyrin repeat domain-containing protein [Puniceicoccales bacterium]|jgi:ankyrin repeat protein|nr:ankyrin repeat domain-containing protein [Puniceicoccales bacterium]
MDSIKLSSLNGLRQFACEVIAKDANNEFFKGIEAKQNNPEGRMQFLLNASGISTAEIVKVAKNTMENRLSTLSGSEQFKESKQCFEKLEKLEAAVDLESKSEAKVEQAEVKQAVAQPPAMRRARAGARRPTFNKQELSGQFKELIGNIGRPGRDFANDFEKMKELVGKGIEIDGADISLAWEGAIASGNIEMVEFLVEEKNNMRSNPNPDSDTPLHMAVKKGNIEMVKVILEHNKTAANKDLTTENYEKDTPLAWAIKEGKKEIVDLILSQDASVLEGCLAKKDMYGVTPLHMAVQKGDVESAKRMIELGADVNAENKNGGTILEIAVWNKDKDFTEFLLEHGAKWDVQDGNGDTALRLAVRSGDEELLNLFVKHGVKEETIQAIKQKDQEQAAEKAALREKCLENTEQVPELLGKIEGFSKCSEAQQKFILAYAKQMTEGGDKLEFAMAVCADMVKLYQEGIDKKLPTQISQATETSQAEFDAITSSVAELSEIISKDGGDYAIIDNYYEGQVGASGALPSQAMRYFWMTQSLGGDKMEDNFYLGFHKEETEGGKTQEAVKTTEAGLKAKFEKVCEKFCGGDLAKYAKTVIMHKAFAAIALDKIDFPGKNRENCNCKVYRGLAHETLLQSDLSYAQKKEGDTITMRHNIAESTSIVAPLPYFSGAGKDVHTYEVPFARIEAPYFLHTFHGHPLEFWNERELACNLNGLPATIEQLLILKPKK